MKKAAIGVGSSLFLFKKASNEKTSSCLDVLFLVDLKGLEPLAH